MDKIPLPTDSIFKFYALFGLLLLIFSLGATVALHRSTNGQLHQYVVELEQVQKNASSGAPETEREKVVRRLIDVAVKDRKGISQWLTVLAVIGFAVMAFGFYMWQTKIQPIEDETRSLQLEKLRLEVAKAKAESASSRDQS